MNGSGQVSYGCSARLRAALSHQASEIVDSARGLVPTYAEGAAEGGKLVEAAIVKCWLLGDAPWRGRFHSLPPGAVDTAETAAMLDR